MAQLCSAIQVIGTFGLFNLALDLLDLFAQLPDLANGLLFCFPGRMAPLCSEIGQFLAC